MPETKPYLTESEIDAITDDHGFISYNCWVWNSPLHDLDDTYFEDLLWC